MMRVLNPTLYEQIEVWQEQLSPDVDVKTLGHTQDNLHNSKEAIIACLVEQFPISYRQSYEVYHDWFLNVEVYQTYDELQVINVLALGSGSGGDVFGLIQVMEEVFSNKIINVFTVEGNKLALRSQMNIFRHYVSVGLIKNEVNLVPISMVIQPSFKGFKEKLNELCFKPYDFTKFDMIQSFNWMNEKSVRKQMKFLDLYELIQSLMNPNRIAVIAETVDPNSKSEESPVFKRALNAFMMFSSRTQKKQMPLYALTPTPCIARRLAGLSKSQCQSCKGCFDEVMCYVKLWQHTRYDWQSSYLFVMKIASSSLGSHLAKNLQNETIGYQTASQVGVYQERYCTLNRLVKKEVTANAFKLCQEEDS